MSNFFFFGHLWKDNLLYCVCLCYLVKDQLTVFMWVYFWALCSVPLISSSIIWPMPRFLFTVAKSKSWHCVISVFHLHSPSILCWLFWICCLFMRTLEVVYWYPQNNLLGVDRTHTESLDQVGKNPHPINVESSYPFDTFFWIPVSLPYCGVCIYAFNQLWIVNIQKKFFQKVS